MVICQEIAPSHFAADQKCSEVQKIASVLRWYGPRFSPKDVPKFYDLSGITENYEAFQLCINIFVERYRAAGDKGPTVILGYDARGFVLGPPIALALGIPFVLLRKANKNPGILVESTPYHKEYAESNADTMCVRVGSIKAGDRVVLIDDLIATGGTAISGFELVFGLGASVYEFASVVSLPGLNGVAKIHTYENGKFAGIPVFTLIDDVTIGDDMCRDPVDWPSDKGRMLGWAEAEEARVKYNLQ